MQQSKYHQKQGDFASVEQKQMFYTKPPRSTNHRCFPAAPGHRCHTAMEHLPSFYHFSLLNTPWSWNKHAASWVLNLGSTRRPTQPW